MSSTKAVQLCILALGISGCSDTALSVADHRVGGVHSTKCDVYQQSNTNAEALVKYAKDLEASGKITREKLIEVDQEAGIYSQKLSSACRFFTAGDINFAQYQDAVDKADNSYRALRDSLLKTVQPTK